MNDGVKILLERMKTHPEEFVENSFGKWARLIADYKEYLEHEDFEVLEEGLHKLRQQEFTEKVLEGLIDPKPLNMSHNDINPLKAMRSAGATQDPSTVEHMLAHIEAAHAIRELGKEKQKKHETLYGRLKNYLHAE